MPLRFAVPGLTLFVLLAAGCGTSVTATSLNGRSWDASPRSARSVRVYASGAPLRAHDDVALLEAEQTHSLNEQGTNVMLRQLRQRAGQLGCDGIVLLGFTERDGAPPGSGYYFLDPGATTLRATCIVFRDEPYRPARPTARLVAPAAPQQRFDGEEPRQLP
jgi:hypothetical protein